MDENTRARPECKGRSNEICQQVAGPMPYSKEPLVYVLVLNWNNYMRTEECLLSLRGMEYANKRTLVIDNGSSDGSADRLERAHPELEVMRTGSNLGFAGGNNRGIVHALAQGAEYVLLVNNDTVLDPLALTWLVRAAEEEPSAAFVGAKIYYYDKPDVIWLLYTYFNWLRGHPRHPQQGVPDGGQFEDRRTVDYVTGTVMLARSAVVRQIGLMSEDFFLYFEDVEWCLRARRAGYTCVVEPRARAWHHVSATARGPGDRPSTYRQYYFPRSNLMLMRRHAPWWARLSFGPFFAGRVMLTVIRIVGSGMLLRKPRVWSRTRAVLLGCWDGVLGRSGYRKDLED